MTTDNTQPEASRTIVSKPGAPVRVETIKLTPEQVEVVQLTKELRDIHMAFRTLARWCAESIDAPMPEYVASNPIASAAVRAAKETP